MQAPGTRFNMRIGVVDARGLPEVRLFRLEWRNSTHLALTCADLLRRIGRAVIDEESSVPNQIQQHCICQAYHAIERIAVRASRQAAAVPERALEQCTASTSPSCTATETSGDPNARLCSRLRQEPGCFSCAGHAKQGWQGAVHARNARLGRVFGGQCARGRRGEGVRANLPCRG
jgi:hypothetical protein